MPEKKIRILIVDHHRPIRESWKLLLESSPRFEVVALCADARSAVDEVEEHRPDIVLMDINIDALDGLAATRELLKRDPRIRVIGISVNNQPTYARRMLEAGGRGYITKTSPYEEIWHGIREIHEGRIYISEEVRKQMNEANH